MISEELMKQIFFYFITPAKFDLLADFQKIISFLKFYFPFECKQSPKQFLLSKGIKCRE